MSVEGEGVDNPVAAMLAKLKSDLGVTPGPPAKLPAVDAATVTRLDAYLDSIGGLYQTQYNPNDYELGRQIMQSAPAEQLQVLYACLRRVFVGVGTTEIVDSRYFQRMASRQLLSALLRRSLPFAEADLVTIVTALRDASPMTLGLNVPARGLLRAVAKQVAAHGLSDPLRTALQGCRDALLEKYLYFDAAKDAAFIDEILGKPKPTQPAVVTIVTGEAWADAALEALGRMPPQHHATWSDLLTFARTAAGARPTKKWMKTAKEKIAAVGEAAFASHVSQWLDLFPKPRTQELPPPEQWHADANLLIDPENAKLLKGLAWCCGGIEDAKLVQALATAATSGYRKIPMFGPRCPAVANAAVLALSVMPGPEPITQLGRLAAQVKQNTGKKSIQKALAAVAERTGQTVEDLTELAIPTFGLDRDGSLRRSVGDFTAEVRLVGSVDAELRWVDDRGKARKSVPVEIKRDHAPALKDLQWAVKELRKMLPAQRNRLERLLLNPRDWSFNEWKQRYLEHPLIGQLSRRLIWEFMDGNTTSTGIWHDGRLVDASSKLLTIAPTARVRLWHPIVSGPDAIQAWRRWLQDNRVAQPFKQAHREIYLLTDAERTTGTYSNRFAAHVLRQHQFVALCQQRGWQTALQGGWDGGDQTPRLDLAQWRMHAEFYTDLPDGGGGDMAMNGTGVALYLVTDQVRFYPTGATQPMPLDRVSPVVFSEVMRDVDLFVGVTSVGNDPTWQDGGPEGRFLDYWHHCSFGDLGATAQTRKDVIERLLPRLKIKDRCALTDKFLVVRGDLRTYKIHLGSGNILMEPNDQYLCIVAARGATGLGNESRDVFLPFEGDATLSIILSKAFLLAEDMQIADPSITRQINAR